MTKKVTDTKRVTDEPTITFGRSGNPVLNRHARFYLGRYNRLDFSFNPKTNVGKIVAHNEGSLKLTKLSTSGQGSFSSDAVLKKYNLQNKIRGIRFWLKPLRSNKRVLIFHLKESIMYHLKNKKSNKSSSHDTNDTNDTNACLTNGRQDFNIKVGDFIIKEFGTQKPINIVTLDNQELSGTIDFLRRLHAAGVQISKLIICEQDPKLSAKQKKTFQQIKALTYIKHYAEAVCFKHILLQDYLLQNPQEKIDVINYDPCIGVGVQHLNTITDIVRARISFGDKVLFIDTANCGGRAGKNAKLQASPKKKDYKYTDASYDRVYKHLVGLTKNTGLTLSPIDELKRPYMGKCAGKFGKRTPMLGCAFIIQIKSATLIKDCEPSKNQPCGSVLTMVKTIKDHKIRQAAIAYATGVSQPLVSRFLNGYEVSPKNLHKFAVFCEQL